jgi:hypothetical protein
MTPTAELTPPAAAEERKKLCLFLTWLCAQNLTLCVRNPLTGEFWPAQKHLIDLLDEYQGIDRAQLEAERKAALAVEECPCG